MRLHDGARRVLFIELIDKRFHVIEYISSSFNNRDIIMLTKLSYSFLLGMDILGVVVLFHQIEISVTSILRVAFDKEVELDGAKESALNQEIC